MVDKKKNPNNHKRETPKTKHDKELTSYDTTREQTSTPQKVREGAETAASHARDRKAKGK